MKSGIATVSAEQQRHPGCRPDAADADHLAGEVDEPELVEQDLALVRQREAVLDEQPLQRRP